MDLVLPTRRRAAPDEGPAAVARPGFGADSWGVLWLKIVLIVLLMGAVGISGGLSYSLGHNAEVRALARSFDASARIMAQDFQAALTLKVVAAEMGAKFIASVLPAGSGDGAIVPGFQAFGSDLLRVTAAASYNWFVVVEDAQRANFEASAVLAAQQLDPSGALAAQVAMQGIRERNSSGTFVPAARAPFYVVRWASVPRDDAGLRAAYLQNLYTNDPIRKATINRMFASNASAITPIVPGLTKDPPSLSPLPASIVFAPAYVYEDGNYGGIVVASNVTTQRNNSGRALAAMGFHWFDVLESTMPRSLLSSAVVVLQGPDAVTHTFLWNDRTLVDKGAGDRAAALVPRKLLEDAVSFTANATGLTWCVTLYPTPALVAQFVTAKPRNNALAVVAASIACLLIFGVYEFLVRRATTLMNTRLRANLEQLRKMKQDVEDGCAREAEAKARVLAEEKASRAKDQFVAMVSHEIRTPLNAMSGAAALLAGTSPLSEEQRSLLQLLDAASENVIAIVDDVLQHGALSSGNFPVESLPLCLRRDVLDPAWRMIALQPARREKLARLQLLRHVSADVPERIMGDGTRLLQVITNLLSNSCKFTPEGGTVELRVQLVRSDWLQLQVTDTGIGVDPEQLQKIFLPFCQEEQSTMRQFGGTGLGLTICQRIVTAMGGTLTASSEGRNRGATFTCTIPLKLQEENAAGASTECVVVDAGGSAADTLCVAASSGTPEDGDRPLRVLVAEDDKLCAALMQKILKRLNVDGTVVGNGAAAVAAYEGAVDEPFALILMDLHMPVMDGLTASRRIAELARSEGRHPTPVVALTASCSEEEKRRCAEAGMSGHISKPVKLDVLQTLLHKYRRADG